MLQQLVAVVLLSFFTTACGPVAGRVGISSAAQALLQARQAGAEQAAPYEYAAAIAYLRKAREEQSYSDFWAARHYAQRAFHFATDAIARAGAQGGAPGPKK